MKYEFGWIFDGAPDSDDITEAEYNRMLENVKKGYPAHGEEDYEEIAAAWRNGCFRKEYLDKTEQQEFSYFGPFYQEALSVNNKVTYKSEPYTLRQVLKAMGEARARAVLDEAKDAYGDESGDDAPTLTWEDVIEE